MRTKYLITGASGQLGSELTRLLGSSAVSTDLPELDITDPDSVGSAVEAFDPEWIINCAAIVDVDLCQRRPNLALRVHRDGVRNLSMTGRRLLTISTDHVFSGEKDRNEPFCEEDQTSPANVYGESKLLGESEALEGNPGNIIVRTSWMFSSMRGMVPFFWNSLIEKGEVAAVMDQVACLTYVSDLARAVVDLMLNGGRGLYHIASRPGLTPAQAAAKLAEATGGRVKEVLWSDLDLDAPRPVYSEIASSRDIRLPVVWDALERWRKSNVRNR